jgi:outer membrane protein TolC
MRPPGSVWALRSSARALPVPALAVLLALAAVAGRLAAQAPAASGPISAAPAASSPPAVPAPPEASAPPASGAVTSEAAAEGPLLPGPRLGVAAVVDETLRLSPEVQRAVSVLAQQHGSLQQATGAFDRTFSITSNLDYNRLDLTNTLIESEIDRRLRLELPAQALDQAASQIAANTPTNGSLLFSNCALANTVVEVQPGSGQAPVFICFNASNQVIGFVLNNQTTGLSSVTVSAFDRLALFSALQQNGFSISLDTQEQLDGLADLLRFLSRQLHLAASSLRLQYFELGNVPEEEDTIDFETDLAYQWNFRTGISLTPMLSLEATEDHYGGKTMSPIFGDTLVPNLNTVTLGVTLNVPLGKGRGEVSADAPERAARATVKAAEDLVAQTASEQALAVVQAYLDMAVAEDHLRLELRAEDAQGRIYDGTTELAKGEQAAQLDVKRAAGRLAQTRADVATARQALTQARLSMQQVMGSAATAAGQAPLPLQSLSELLGDDPPASLDPEILVRQALDRRSDLRAAEEQTLASRILAEAARADLKLQVDLALNASFNGLHESVRDRFYDPAGYGRAIADPIAGPSYSAMLNFSWPFANNKARGNLAQADSTLAQAEIRQIDLRRSIRLQVIELLAALRRSRRALDLARQSMDYSEQTLEASVERFKGGDLSVIDTLTTEQAATTASLAWVDALHNHLGLVAQLRFQINALLAAARGESRPEAFQLLPLSSPLG